MANPDQGYGYKANYSSLWIIAFIILAILGAIYFNSLPDDGKCYPYRDSSGEYVGCDDYHLPTY